MEEPKVDGKASAHKNSRRAVEAPPDVASPALAKSGLMVGLAALRSKEARRLALFAPAALACGVAAAFAQSGDPEPARIALVAIGALFAAVAALYLARLGGLRAAALRVLLIALSLASVGYLAAERRIALSEAPVWPEGLRGEREVSGRALAVLRSGSGALKLRLDRLQIEGAKEGATPERVEIRLRAAPSEGAALLALVGRRVGLRARLFPPPGPAEPGAFDYRQRAYFQQLGALGVQAQGVQARLRDLGPSGASGVEDRLRAEVGRLRAELSARARAAAPGVEGAVIAALLFGDRSGLPQKALSDLRDANLAHLLAISGLHMAMVCLTVFAAFRLVFALPARRLFRLSGKKAAALAAMAAGFCYLQLSGGGAPPERAFVMIACAFGAMLADRPAVTLRAVALAAIILLLLRPESLFDPGFQLSFAATTALVAVFEASRSVWRRDRSPSPRRMIGLWLAALAVSSVTAGLATAPFAGLIFNRFSRYGLIANLAAVPAMGLWIMPLGVMALALTPLGLDGPLYALMALGVGYVLGVAEAVASLPGARILAPAGPPGAAALFALAGLFFCLWRSPWLKAVGAAPLIAALALWGQAQRPEALIAREGRLIGVLTAEGRAFDRDVRRHQRYSAELWLRRDGDGAGLSAAAARRGFTGRRGVREAPLSKGWTVLRHARRGESWRDLAARCRPGVLIVAPRLTAPVASIKGEPFKRPTEGCLLLDRPALRRHGAIAFWPPDVKDGAPRWKSARSVAPQRSWTDEDDN